MAILVKVKDSTNDSTDFKYIRNDKVNEFDKSEYILQEITPEDDKFIQFIYPGQDRNIYTIQDQLYQRTLKAASSNFFPALHQAS